MSHTIVGVCLTFILLLLPNSLKRIGEQNKLISESEEAFAAGNMELAIAKQKALIDILEGDERQSLVRLNLALSYQRLEEKEEALRLFNQLLSETNAEVASIAANQLGLMQAAENDFEEALGSFRYALIKNYENETARYNFELLKRWMEENPPSDDQQDENQTKTVRVTIRIRISRAMVMSKSRRRKVAKGMSRRMKTREATRSRWRMSVAKKPKRSASRKRLPTEKVT
ncbi:hypothetical protein A3SI_03870 [Nitritalea halalkaliphila LW7]|uniref:Uncharacterized protein n=1 Tax=Nitritalea halalkaliphila LW7 TaxID=1189621 RepID=I5C978_9BACT|nr:hypothetical protein [Nitritalea halalkaliphila]EIM78380.1 hypothetical protein A3SI_03870 [Nitritalea halalkaliphila LW7]